MNESQLNTIESYNRSAGQFFERIAKLPNYNHTYDVLIEKLNNNDCVLDLACGPAQISKYIMNKKHVNITGVDLSDKMLQIAQKELPSGNFYKDSIITFTNHCKYHAVIIGFGIPYLDKTQTEECIKNAIENIIDNYYLYISFMDGKGCRVEKTSFGGDNDFTIYYYKKDEIEYLLEKYNMKIIKDFELDYQEKDGSISKDIILIGQKYN